MGSIKGLRNFVKKYPYLGPILWVMTAQYFVITYIVSRSWHPPYSLAHNSISDLGNTACGIYANRLASNSYVCSPKHTLMNTSFVLTGALMILGAKLIYPLFKKSRNTLIGLSCIGLGGLGAILVGLFPENTTSALHTTGAALDFLVGNVGLVILGFSLRLPKMLKVYTLFTGFLTLIFLVFYTSKVYLGLGLGGTERLASYPQTIWLIVFGIYLVYSKYSLKNS
ncbi:MAG TPA: DUF998 domain-containing protein [Candidatus Binatia bacterium]|nr:DUF998 domain-containing protein [Candidatus Binatia bacterium]